MPACSPSARLNALTLERNIPVSVTAELTRRCPLSCLHCYLPETRGRAKPGPELGTAAWRRILKGLASEGALFLNFTGGEPLLRRDLAELCRSAKALGFDVRIFSTGTGMTAALAAELKSAGVSAFEISVYGRPAVHDAVTLKKGSFSSTLAAIRLIRRAGMAVKMKVPLMDGNASQVRWLKALAKKETCKVSFDPVIVPANDGDRSALKHRLSGRRLSAAVSVAASGELRTAGPEEPSAGDLICGAGRNVCAITPDGTLYPCLQLPVKLGNLGRENFGRVWKNSPWLKRWRGAGLADLAKCRDCVLLEHCSRCPGISLLEEGDVHAPNKAACALARAQAAAAGKRR
jgi:radical SAM protein with 4Fe4S-binding SPASM domain